MTSEQPPGAVIKTTARFQEAQEPLKQKPIIQIDPAAPLQQYENLARSSIDSGRDNPFRPDGKIYKSADPIVDYYKFGPHQSRAHSPTDSQLLVGKQFGDDDDDDVGDERRLKASGKKWWKRKRADDKKKHSDRPTKDDARPTSTKKKDAKERPCWRRWFCCCCCCFERDDGSCCCCSRQKKEEKFDTSQYESPPSVDAKTKDFKQSKIVVLQTGDESDRSIIASHNSQQNGRNETSDRLVSGGSLPDFDPNTEPKTLTKTTETMPILATDQKVAAENHQQQQTRAKRPEHLNKSKRCVIT